MGTTRRKPVKRVICAIAFSSGQAEDAALSIGYRRKRVKIYEAEVTAEGLTQTIHVIVANVVKTETFRRRLRKLHLAVGLKTKKPARKAP